MAQRGVQGGLAEGLVGGEGPLSGHGLRQGQGGGVGGQRGLGPAIAVVALLLQPQSSESIEVLPLTFIAAAGPGGSVLV